MEHPISQEVVFHLGVFPGRIGLERDVGRFADCLDCPQVLLARVGLVRRYFATPKVAK